MATNFYDTDAKKEALIREMQGHGFDWEYPGFFCIDVNGLNFTVGIDDDIAPLVCQATTRDGYSIDLGEHGDCKTVAQVLNALARFKADYPGHTPGPWDVLKVEAERNCLVKGKGRKRGQRSQMVAQVWSGDDRSMDVATMNARLIAAAPALLAAAKLALRCGVALHDRKEEATEALREAIEAAEDRKDGEGYIGVKS